MPMPPERGIWKIGHFGATPKVSADFVRNHADAVNSLPGPVKTSDRQAYSAQPSHPDAAWDHVT
jgi:hypothetical protein